MRGFLVDEPHGHGGTGKSRDGPWSGPGYSYTGWDDYAARYGIVCHPGTVVPGQDGIMYYCQ
jgi:hypothetical protein